MTHGYLLLKVGMMDVNTVSTQSWSCVTCNPVILPDAQDVKQQLGPLEGQVRDSVTPHEILTAQLATACQAAADADDKATQARTLILPSTAACRVDVCPYRNRFCLSHVATIEGKQAACAVIRLQTDRRVHGYRRPKPAVHRLRLASLPQPQTSPCFAPAFRRLKPLPMCALPLFRYAGKCLNAHPLPDLGLADAGFHPPVDNTASGTCTWHGHALHKAAGSHPLCIRDT